MIIYWESTDVDHLRHLAPNLAFFLDFLIIDHPYETYNVFLLELMNHASQSQVINKLILSQNYPLISLFVKFNWFDPRFARLDNHRFELPHWSSKRLIDWGLMNSVEMHTTWLENIPTIIFRKKGNPFYKATSQLGLNLHHVELLPKFINTYNS